MTLNERLEEIVSDALSNGFDPIEAILGYMAEKDSPMSRRWAEAKVRAIRARIERIATVNHAEAIDGQLAEYETIQETLDSWYGYDGDWNFPG